MGNRIVSPSVSPPEEVEVHRQSIQCLTIIRKLEVLHMAVPEQSREMRLATIIVPDAFRISDEAITKPRPVAQNDFAGWLCGNGAELDRESGRSPRRLIRVPADVLNPIPFPSPSH